MSKLSTPEELAEQHRSWCEHPLYLAKAIRADREAIARAVEEMAPQIVGATEYERGFMHGKRHAIIEALDMLRVSKEDQSRV